MPTAGEAGAAGPYPEFARRRELGDAVEEEVEATPDGPRQWFGVYRWDAVRSALGDEALSARLYHDEMGLRRRYGELLLGMDEPDHRLHRAVLQPSFSRSAVAARAGAVVAAPVDRLVARMGGGRSADLVASLCEPAPALVLAALLGLADDDADLLRDQARALARDDRDQAATASDALHERLRPLIRARRQAPPGDDLVSVLAHGRLGERPLTDLEVFSHLRLLAIAGTDTVTRATANLLFALLTHPEQLQAVARDHRLLPAAVEEAVRWECPAVAVPRVVVRDTRIGSVAVPAGSAVRVCLGAANRDPRRWDDPDRFDIHREHLPHAGFGIGGHACLGLHLAHQVMQHVVLAVVERLAGVRLDPDAPPPTIAGWDLRSPERLRVRWD